jgi:hypothetical protein
VHGELAGLLVGGVGEDEYAGEVVDACDGDAHTDFAGIHDVR